MKKLVVLTVVFSFLLAGMFAAKPAAAWSAITGTVFAGDGSRWTHGGTVEVFDQGGVSCGVGNLVTGNPSLNGNYSVALPGGCSPLVGQPMYIVLQTNAGPGGTPSNQLVQITYLNTGTVWTQNFNTGTTPTAVTLANFSAPTASSSLPYVVAAVVSLLSMASYIVWRRRPLAA